MSSIEARSVFATLPRTERGKPIVLGADPKGKTFLYVNGNSVIIRDLENPSVADIYTEHSQPTAVAKYAPSGFYIASGDVSGKLRIWDTVNKEHILKCEFQPISGVIKDVSWSPDSKRIALCGEGRSKYAAVIMYDSGTSVGEIIGHSKAVNSIDYRPERPFRVVTGSEDYTGCFFEGPPFKFKETLRDHTNFVNVVRYSPNGEVFATGAADGKVFVYDGKTAELRGEVGASAHKGGVYAIAFSPDSHKLLTVSADKTAKIWDVAEKILLLEYVFGKDLIDMQVGCLWSGDTIITISLSGYINYLDANSASLKRVVKGHNKPITAMCISEDRSTIFTGSSDAHVNYWNADTGVDDEFPVKGHSNQIQHMVVNGDDIISVSMDDSVRYASVSGKHYTDRVIKVDSMPKSVASRGAITIVTTINGFVVLENGRQIGNHKVPYEPIGIDIHPECCDVAVGGSKDNTLYIYSLSNGTLTEKSKFEIGAVANDIKYSPDGAYLAFGCGDRKVHLYQVSEVNQVTEYKKIYDSSNHQARVNTVGWAPNSQHFATAGLDGSIVVWKLKLEYTGVLSLRNAHKQSQITRLEWLNDNVIVTVGQDSNVKQWNVKIS